jgi:O-acetyl-ADP-ribose deacetylase (regulator of RNase III)
VSANYWKPVTGHASRSLKASNFRKSHFRPSRGIYGFPNEIAARIALNAVTRHLAGHDFPEQVIFVCFDPTTLQAYEAALAQ